MSSPLVDPRIQFSDVNGLPLAGGKLYSYIAGTSTPKATYTTSAGTVANANPVILDSSGRASVFLTGIYKFELRDADNVLIWTADNIKELLSSPLTPFTLYSAAPTAISTVAFTVPGDATGTFFAFQRVKFVTSSTTVYGGVMTSIFSAGITTVTLSVGSPINVGTPVSVSYGLGDPGLPIDARHVYYPRTTTSSVYDELLRKLDLTGGTLTGPISLNYLGFTVTGGGASGIPLGTANVMNIGGTGWTVTNMGTVVNGLVTYLHFVGSGTLSGAGTNFQTPNGLDVTVVPGDVVQVTGANSKWVINKLTPAAGSFLGELVYTANSSFDPAVFPAARLLKVRVKAGGAGGGDATTADGAAGGGGAEGTEVVAFIFKSSFAGVVQDVRVGASSAGLGNSSWFGVSGPNQLSVSGGGGGNTGISATIAARGGQGGIYTLGANYTLERVYRGACGHGGAVNSYGGAGGGSGGNGSNASGVNGFPGLDGTGGGGGGGVRLGGVDTTGGVGGSGIVIVEMYS